MVAIEYIVLDIEEADTSVSYRGRTLSRRDREKEFVVGRAFDELGCSSQFF